MAVNGREHPIGQQEPSEPPQLDSDWSIRRMLDKLPAAAYLCDLEGRLTYYNQFAANLWGGEPALNCAANLDGGFLRQHTTDGLPISPVYSEAVPSLKAGRGFLEDEIVLERPDGTHVTTLLHSSPVRGEAGDIRGVINVLVDISNRKRAEEALRESEARFRTFVDHAADAFFLIVPGGAIVDVNRQACESLGYKRDELLGMMPLTLDPDVTPELVKRTTALLDAGESVTFDSNHRRKDGSMFPVEVRIRPFVSDGKQFRLALVRDMTAHKRSEQALLETSQFSEQIVSSFQDGLIVLDRDQRYQLWNKKMEEISGMRAEEVLGKHPLELFPFLRALGIDLLYERVLAGEKVTVPDFTYEVSSTGRRGWNSQIMAPLRNAQGGIVGIIVTVFDMTERKQQEESLRFFRSLIDRSRDAIEVIDFQTGRFLDVNDRACLDLGYSREELLSLSVPDIDPMVSIHEFHQNVAKVRATGVLMMESQHRRKDGSCFPVEINVSYVHLDQEYLVSVVRDSTERKKAEEERRKLEEQVRHSQKLESLGILAGGIAHDFNNLLTSVLGNTNLVLNELPPGSPLRPLLDEVEKAAQRAAKLTAQMLAYSGRGKFVIQVLRLDHLVQEMSSLLQSAVSKKAVFRLELEPASIEGDSIQIRQIVMNLLTNASDALGEQPGVITLRTGQRVMESAELHSPYLQQELPAGPYAFLQVADSGCGMSQEVQSKVFDPFFTTKFTGRGLGLAAVLGIVRGHHGTIQVASAPGQGTLFEVFFPAMAESTRAIPEAPPVKDMSQGCGSILVVEDEEAIRLVVRIVLESAGFHVLLASNGQEGLALFAEQKDEIQAVVLDLTMPHLDGWEVFTRLRSLRADVPVLLMSGYDKPETPDHVAKSGAPAFLHKPFHPKELIAQVRAMVS